MESLKVDYHLRFMMMFNTTSDFLNGQNRFTYVEHK